LQYLPYGCSYFWKVWWKVDKIIIGSICHDQYWLRQVMFFICCTSLTYAANREMFCIFINLKMITVLLYFMKIFEFVYCNGCFNLFCYTASGSELDSQVQFLAGVMWFFIWHLYPDHSQIQKMGFRCSLWL
jgi:hypothetical protein